jgi:F0F1-type ATP synthase delta subunit
LSSKTKADIKALLGAKKVILNTNVDKSVIGGVRVESGEQLLDLTVRNRLTRLKGAHKTV